MIRRIAYLILVIFLLSMQSVFCQSVEDYTIKHYTSKNGLPQNSIKSMIMDNNRFVWFTTEGGVVRFDGQFFKVFNHYNKPEILNDRFTSILKTIDGKYFTYEQASTIFEIKNGKIELIKEGDRKTPPKTVFKGGIPDFDFMMKILSRNYPGIEPKDFPQSGILKVFPLDTNSFAILLKDRIMFFDNGKSKIEFPINELKMQEIFLLEGTVYYSDNKNQFHYFDLVTKSVLSATISGLSEAPSIQGYNFSNNITWGYGYPDVYIKYGNNLYRLNKDKAEQKLQVSLVTTDLPANTLISNAFFDVKSQNLFIGTETKGLYVFRKNKIKTIVFNSPSEVSNNSYYSQCEIDSGVVMTQQKREFTLKGGRPLSIPFSQISHEVLLKDKQNVIWSFKGDSIVSYNLNTKELFGLRPLPGIDYYSMMEDGDSIFVAGLNGIGYLKNRVYKHIYNYKSSNPDEKIEDLLRGPDGNLWIARCSGVSFQNTSTGEYEVIKGLQGICARVLFRYGSKVFIGTYGDGYFVWDNGKVVRLPNDKSNFLSHVHSFFIDKRMRLWMSTNKGLLKTSYHNIEKFLADPEYKFSYQVYGEDDGILNSEFNGGCTPAVLRLSNGYVTYPTMEGLVWFIPEAINDEFPDERIFIDELRVNEKSINVAGNISIPPNHESIKITFSAPYWGNVLNLNTEYILEGFNKEWVTLAPGENTIQFSNLHSGNYTLKIRRLNGEIDNAYTETKLSFVVEKKFFETTPFILLAIFLSASLLLLILKLNSNRIINKNIELEKRITERTTELRQANYKLEENYGELALKEQFLRESINVKNRLISVISHDIITPLKFISMVSRISKRNPDMIDRNKLIESMNDIEFASDKLYNNASNILNWMKFQNNRINLKMDYIGVHDFIDEIIEPLQGMAEIKGIKIENRVPEEDLIVSDRNILMIVLQNLLSNAIKYSEKGTISFSAKFIQEDFEIVVRDNGIGMSEQTIKEIELIKKNAGNHLLPESDHETGNQLGYYIITDFLNLMKGTIDVKSQKGIGTEVTVILKQ